MLNGTVKYKLKRAKFTSEIIAFLALNKLCIYMNYKIAALILFLAFGTSLHAQTIKTDVLVFGSNASAVAAAIQSARSGVKTILITETDKLGSDIKSANNALSAGIWAEFMKHVKDLKKDTNAIADPFTSAAILKGITDTVKNLTIRYNSGLRKIEKDGKGWEVKLTDNKNSVKAFAIVDATVKSDIAAAARVNYNANTKSYLTLVPGNPIVKLYESNLYRTSIAAGTGLKSNSPYIVSFGSLIAEGQNNIFITGNLASIQSSADAMLTGQAAGAAAAYCAFFKKTTKDFNENAVRETQSELLKFKSVLLPYLDIDRKDYDFIALQHIGLTGILKAKQMDKGLFFMPDATVSSEEIKQPMKEYYSRSQIWFVDKKIEKITLADALSLIKYVGTRGDELNREVEKGWKDSFGFNGKFDLDHFITRKEFAVLIESLLKPYTVRVNLVGELGS